LIHYRRALRIWEKTLSPDHYQIGYGLTGLGEALLGLDSPGEARSHLERALKIFSRQELDPTVVAEARLALAQALQRLGLDPDRASRLAAGARAAFAAAGPPGRRKLAAIEARLARPVHRP